MPTLPGRHPRGFGFAVGAARLGALRASRLAAVLALASALLTVTSASARTPPLFRLEVHPAPDAMTRPRPLLFTVGGPVYCMQLATLARHIDASLACTDYGSNRYEAAGGRALREEDWGDPVYDTAVAKIPDQLRRQGLRISKLIVVGVSYSGYANAELVATHPEMRPDALIIVDSYLDLPARYQALPAHHQTRSEIEHVVGGTLAERPAAYAARSPSNHLHGLATAIGHGMKLIVVWSLSPDEKREFLGATCSRLANAQWLANLATLAATPITAYITQMKHAHALWDRGQGLLQLAGIRNSGKALFARPVIFQPHRPPPANSYC